MECKIVKHFNVIINTLNILKIAIKAKVVKNKADKRYRICKVI